MELAQIQNELRKRLGDRHSYYANWLERCQSLSEVLAWVAQSCPVLGADLVFSGDLLLSLFTQAQLDGARVFVRRPGQGLLMPEKQGVSGFYSVFGGQVSQHDHTLHGSFFEGAVAEVKAGHACFYHQTSGTLTGPSVGHIYKNARVTALGGSSAYFFNQATGVGKDQSHVVCMGYSAVELYDQSFGLAIEHSKLTYHDHSRGRVMGKSICLCRDNCSVTFGEEATGLILSADKIEATGKNRLYRFSSKCSVSASRTTTQQVLNSKDQERWVAAYEAYQPTPGKEWVVPSELG